jgi:predicted dehydrogenase
MKTVNAGVIGTGFIGPAHVEALRRTPGVQVLAIGSNEPDRARDVAARFGIPRVYDSWEAVIRDRDVEVVHNCTPNNLHFAINRAAIEAGKHIVSEKPLTMTSKESAALLALLKKRPVVNAVNFNYRMYPLIQHARAMTRRGDLGTVHLIHGHYTQDWLLYDTDYNWRLEPEIGGASRAVADIGSHWCDLVQFVSGNTIVEVMADLLTVHPKRWKPAGAVDTFKGKESRGVAKGVPVTVGTEDAGVIMFRLDNGGRGVVTVSQVSAGRKNREWFEIDGGTAALAWDQEEPNQLWIGHRERPNESLLKDPSLLDAAARPYAHYPGGHPEGYPDGPKNLFAGVYAAVRSRPKSVPARADFPTFADGHRENLIVDAVLASHRQRLWVRVKHSPETRKV